MSEPDIVLVTGAEAARWCGVGRSAICKWRDRGYLPVEAQDEVGRPLYRLDEVTRVEEETRLRGGKRHDTEECA